MRKLMGGSLHLVLLLLLTGTAWCATPAITSVKPGIVSAGEVVSVDGTHFDVEPGHVTIQIEKVGAGAAIKPVLVKPEDKGDGLNLKFKMPDLEWESSTVSVSVANVGSVFSNAKHISYYAKKKEPQKTDPVISEISPTIVTDDDLVTVNGENFKAENIAVAVTKIDKDDKPQGGSVPVKPEKADAKSLEFKWPKIQGGSTRVAVSVVNFGVAKSNERVVNYYSSGLDPYVQTAIRLKKTMTSAQMLDHISKKIEEDVRSGKATSALFTGVKLSDTDVLALKDAGYDADFIAQLEGQDQQYVTLGWAAVFLPNGAQVTTAPMLRVLLTPKSYFRPRFPLMSSTYVFTKDWLNGIREAIDFNVGYTVVTTKSESTETKTNYFLTGLSYEINKSALLNIGAAFPVNNATKNSVKFYTGITLDQNLLKNIGLLK
jgi:hypothetical protein